MIQGKGDQLKRLLLEASQEMIEVGTSGSHL
jgi:hypothetical protein